MVTNCPNSFWPSPPHVVHNRLLASDADLGSVIRDKCERTSTEGHPYTYHLDLPVHSMGSGFDRILSQRLWVQCNPLNGSSPDKDSISLYLSGPAMEPLSGLDCICDFVGDILKCLINRIDLYWLRELAIGSHGTELCNLVFKFITTLKVCPDMLYLILYHKSIKWPYTYSFSQHEKVT